MMKRWSVLAVAGLMAAAVALPAEAQKRQVKMSTIAPGSSMYLVMTTFANLVNQGQKDFEITVDATGTATKHMVDVARGSIDMSMTAPIAIAWMKAGTKVYKKLKGVKELAKKLRIVFWFPAGAYHYTVYENSGIRTLADLQGQARLHRSAVGRPAGDRARVQSRRLTGLDSRKGDFKSVNLNFASALQAFQDRQIDVYTIACPRSLRARSSSSRRRPRSASIGLPNAADLRKSEALKKFFTPLGRINGVVKKGAYGSAQANEADVYSNGAILGVTAREGLDNDTVYAMTKLFWSNLEGIRDSAPYMDAVVARIRHPEGQHGVPSRRREVLQGSGSHEVDAGPGGSSIRRRRGYSGMRAGG